MNRPRNSIIFLLVLAVLIVAVMRPVQIQVDKINSTLTAPILVKAETIRPKPLQWSREAFDSLVDRLFPREARNRFRAIVGCENGRLEPKRVNRNKDGSYDLGIAQINSRWHKARVEKVFQEPFDEAMGDPIKNLTYASMLYKEWGSFQPWVCDRLVASR